MTTLARSQTQNETVREAIFFALAVEGLTPKYVAAQFSVPGGAKEVLRIYEEVRIERQDDYENHAALVRHFNRVNYERILRTSNEAFEESRLPKKKTVERSWSGGENGSGSSEETQEEERVGDPRFLTVQLAALKEIGNLVGAEQPKTVNINTRSTHQVFVDLLKLPEEELARRAAMAQLEQEGVLVIDQQPASAALPGQSLEQKVEESCPRPPPSPAPVEP